MNKNFKQSQESLEFVALEMTKTKRGQRAMESFKAPAYGNISKNNIKEDTNLEIGGGSISDKAKSMMEFGRICDGFCKYKDAMWLQHDKSIVKTNLLDICKSCPVTKLTKKYIIDEFN